MAFDVVLDPKVVDRVDEIVDYLSNALSSPAAASNFLDGLDELVTNLESLPLSYPFSLDARLAARGYRKALIGNYVLLFRVVEAGERNGTVYVTNLFHGSQDYQGLV